MPRGGQAAARIRAAHAYSDLSRDDLAAKIGVSPRQLGRLESGEAAADRDLCDRIADACDVPRVFMRVGFEPLADPIGDVDQRIYVIEQRIAEIAANVRPERLLEIFRPVLGEDAEGDRPARQEPRQARRAKGRRRAAGEGRDT